MLHIKIKEPDYKKLYFESLEANKLLNETRNKTISGLKGRNTKLENEIITLKRQLYQR